MPSEPDPTDTAPQGEPHGEQSSAAADTAADNPPDPYPPAPQMPSATGVAADDLESDQSS